MTPLLQHSDCPVLTVGADPEFFVTRPSGEVLPAFDWLPTKHEVALGEPYADGFQVEFGVAPGATGLDLVQQAREALRRLHAAATATGGTISFHDTVTVPPDRTFTMDQLRLGCEPSANAYGETSPLERADVQALRYRSAGAHIHVGLDMASSAVARTQPSEVVAQVDDLVGPMLVALCEGLEDPRRRHLYGRAGEYRLKPYGFEWRVPAPAMYVHPVVTQVVYDLVRGATALTLCDPGRLPARWYTTYVINSVSVAGARYACRTRRVFYEMLMHEVIGYDATTTATVLRLIEDGVLKHYDPKRYVEAWEL